MGTNNAFTSDYMEGRGGDDWFYAYDGADATLGGTDRDYSEGDAGDDDIYGGSGNDWTYNVAGDAVGLMGRGGGDEIRGGDHTDVAYGGNSADIIVGEGGDDYLVSWDDSAPGDLVAGDGGFNSCYVNVNDDYSRCDRRYFP